MRLKEIIDGKRAEQQRANENKVKKELIEQELLRELMRKISDQLEEIGAEFEIIKSTYTGRWFLGVTLGEKRVPIVVWNDTFGNPKGYTVEGNIGRTANFVNCRIGDINKILGEIGGNLV